MTDDDVYSVVQKIKESTHAEHQRNLYTENGNLIIRVTCNGIEKGKNYLIQLVGDTATEYARGVSQISEAEYEVAVGSNEFVKKRNSELAFREYEKPGPYNSVSPRSFV